MIGGGPQKITVEIGGKIAASLGASLRSAQMQVSGFGRNVSRTMNDAALAGRKGFKGMFDNALWQGAAAGATAIGVGMAASVRVAANFENVLTEIGKTANASQGELKVLSGEILKLSGRNMTNLGPAKLAEGIQDLVARGLNLKDAVASMESLGRVATATGSDLLDVTKTGFQLQNALKIRPTELKATFDALAFAGKQGAFELKDMAQFMPTIAAAADTLGITGKQGAVSLAAMMQMVRKDAPDAGQAATRLTDAMLKMTAPDAVKKFQKFGVNIKQVLNNAKAKGINPMEAALDELQRVTGGDAFKLSEIFGDKEAKLALMSLMKYRKEYTKLRDDAGGAAAAGTVDQDFERSLKTFTGTLTSFQNSAQRLGISVGNALLPPLTRLAEIIAPIAEGIASWGAANPELMTGIVAIGGALSGLVLALPIIAGVISAIGTIKLAFAGANIAGLIAGWLPAILGAGKALLVFATGPVGLTIAAIVGIGLAIKAVVDYWPEISTAATQAWWQVKAAWGQFTPWIGAVFNQAGAAIQAAWSGIVGFFQQAWSTVMGAGLGQFVEGIKSQFSGLATYFQGVWNTIVGIFTLDASKAVAGVRQAFSGLDQIGAGLLQTGLGLGRLIVTGIGAGLKGIGAALAALGGWIMQGLTALGSAIVSGLAAIPGMVGSALGAMASIAISIFSRIVQAGRNYVEQLVATWRALPGRIVGGLKALISGVRSVFDRVVNFIKQTPSRVASVGKAVIDAILNGLKSRAGALFGWISGTWDRMKNMVGGGGNSAAPAAASGSNRQSRRTNLPGRAMGGPVSAGMPYIVGEKRRELFVPGIDGAIIPRIARPLAAGALAGLMATQPAPAAAPASPAISLSAPAAAPVNIQPPMQQQQRAAAPVTIHAPITINAAGGDAMEIRRQVELAFVDIQREIESSHRMLLND